MVVPPSQRNGDSRVLFAVFQTGSGANGGVESVTQILENLSDVEKVVVTQRQTPVNARWEAIGTVVMLKNLAGIAQKLRWTSPLEVLRRAASLIRNNLQIWVLYASSPFSVLHANDLDALMHTAFGARLRGVPVLLNVRDIHEPERGYGYKWWLARRLSDRLVALSEEMTGQLRLRLPRAGRDGSDLRHIYSIVDRSRMHPLDPIERAERRVGLGLLAGEFAIGYVANVFLKKNQLGFLEGAAADILQKVPNARLHFLGDFDPVRDPYARQCLETARKVDPDLRRIVFHGYTADVAAWYPALDLVALASRREGLARCMIEGLACGTPVVSFDVCSAREILEANNCGRVVAQGDFSGFAGAVTALAGDDDLRREMGQRGVALAAQHFDAKLAIAAYMQAYGDLANARFATET